MYVHKISFTDMKKEQKNAKWEYKSNATNTWY
jgi:hypothetical protein